MELDNDIDMRTREFGSLTPQCATAGLRNWADAFPYVNGGLFSGRLEIDYLNEKYGMQFPEGEYHTLSGYLVTKTADIPDQGAVLDMDGYRFILELVSSTRIETVRVVKLEP